MNIDSLCSIVEMTYDDKVLTVSQVSQVIKRTLETEFAEVQVKGEISGFLHHTSGHMYFGIKDSSAVMDCVCWRSQVSQLSLKPEDGMEVVCVGRVTTYAGRSKYQLMIKDIKLEGVGAILKMLEERKRKLEGEGLFAECYKKPLPAYPQHIAVLTSPTGAVIRDIVHRVTERYPSRVTVFPCVMQGNQAVESVVNAFNSLKDLRELDRPDVVIVARGGGSIEDLLPFSDEAIVRAVFACDIPVISAIGHEVDNTLIDLVADRRAPTPTAAAEMATPSKTDLITRLTEMESRAMHYIHRFMTEKRAYIEGIYVSEHRLIEAKWLKLGEMMALIQSQVTVHLARHKSAVQDLCVVKKQQKLAYEYKVMRERIVSYVGKIQLLQQQQLYNSKADLESCARLLEGVSPKNILSKGYAMLFKGDQPVRSVKSLEKGDSLDIALSDGRCHVRVES